jgi:hypothetical protein
VRHLLPAPIPYRVLRFPGLPGEHGPVDPGDLIVMCRGDRRERPRAFSSRLYGSAPLFVEFPRRPKAGADLRTGRCRGCPKGGAWCVWVLDNPRVSGERLDGRT